MNRQWLAAACREHCQVCVTLSQGHPCFSLYLCKLHSQASKKLTTVGIIAHSGRGLSHKERDVSSLGTMFWLVAYCVSLDCQSHTPPDLNFPTGAASASIPHWPPGGGPWVFLASPPNTHTCLQPRQENSLGPTADIILSFSLLLQPMTT